LSTPITATVSLDPDNKFTTTATSSAAAKFKPTFMIPKAGFGGAFIHPATGLSGSKGAGIVLQDWNEGYGFFTSPAGNSGTMTLEVTTTENP
jgi:hypothetical protein